MRPSNAALSAFAKRSQPYLLSFAARSGQSAQADDKGFFRPVDGCAACGAEQALGHDRDSGNGGSRPLTPPLTKRAETPMAASLWTIL